MKNIVTLLTFMILLQACGGVKSTSESSKKPFQSKTLFTHQLRQQIEANADIKKVQFYTTRKIKMKRVSTSEGLEVTKEGKVVVKEGDREELIELEKDLPGVCVAAFEDRLQISFSEGTFLIFRKDFVGTYSLLVDRDIRGVAKIQYGTETYQLMAGGDEAKLSIDKTFKNEDEEDEKAESGRRIGGGGF